MTDDTKPKSEKIENLELNRETIQDLTEQEGDLAQGGMIPQSRTCGDCQQLCTDPPTTCW